MKTEKTIGGELVQGTPKEIVNKVSKDLVELLHKAGIPPTGVYVLALLHVVACAVRAEAKEPTGVKMPSFKTLLSILVHSSTGSPWSNEEAQAFDEEFTGIVESMGGYKVDGQQKSKAPMIMSPSLGVH